MNANTSQRETVIERGLDERLLPFEKLDVYNVSIELVELVAAQRIPRGSANVFDQLKRAATSVALNTAEACGKSGADRKRFFAIARGSALESAAALRVIRALRGVDEIAYRKGRALCQRLYAMLTKLCR